MPAKIFQIALVDRIRSQDASYFDASAKNTITYTLWEHLVRIAHFVPEGLIPGPSWSLRAGQLQAHDVVVYFVLDPSSSIIGGTAPSNVGGRTTTTAGGVASEVYVEGNMPARRLANIAFHEIMHNKLDIGARVISDLHSKGGGGLAVPPTNEWTPLTPANAQLMAQNMFSAIRQFTGRM
jgi:hypothetical protein